MTTPASAKVQFVGSREDREMSRAGRRTHSFSTFTFGEFVESRWVLDLNMSALPSRALQVSVHQALQKAEDVHAQ